MQTLILVAWAALAAAPAGPGESLYLQGVDRVARGDLQGAAERFEGSLGEAPDGRYAASALLMWADTERKRGDDQRAIELYGDLLDRFPTHRLARSAEARKELLLHRASMDEVWAAYWAILEEYDGDEQGAAIGRMEGLLADHPDHDVGVEAHCWLGSQYRLRSDYDSAVAHYEAALESDPEAECNLRALEYIVVAARKRGELDRAGRALERMRDLGEPGLAAYEHHSGELDRARRLVRLGRILGLGALLAMAVCLAGLRTRAMDLDTIRRAAVSGGAVVLTFGGAALLGGGELRPTLLTLGFSLGSLVVLVLLRRRPLPRWLRFTYPPSILWLTAFIVFATLRLFGWI